MCVDWGSSWFVSAWLSVAVSSAAALLLGFYRKKPPLDGRGRGVGVSCVRSDDVDLSCGNEVGAFQASDFEQLLGVSGEVAAGGVDERAGVGSKAEDAVAVVVEIGLLQSNLRDSGDNGVAEAGGVVDGVEISLLNGLPGVVVGEGGGIDLDQIEGVEGLSIGVQETLEIEDFVSAGFAGLTMEADCVLSIVISKINRVFTRATFHHRAALP